MVPVTVLPAVGPVIVSVCAFPLISVPVMVNVTDDKLFELPTVTNEFRFLRDGSQMVSPNESNAQFFHTRSGRYQRCPVLQYNTRRESQEAKRWS